MIKAYAAFEAGGTLKPFEYEPGELGRNEVEIKVESCGIRHSDLSMLDNEWGMAQYPLVQFDVKPTSRVAVIETSPMDQVNVAMQHLRNGKAKYRIVLRR